MSRNMWYKSFLLTGFFIIFSAKTDLPGGRRSIDKTRP